MKKAIIYVIVISFCLFIVGALFWIFLEDVEERGKECALLSVLSVFLYGIFAIVALSLNIAYWMGIAHLLEKIIRNAPKWLFYIISGLYVGIGIYLEVKLCHASTCLEEKYKAYQFQKEFEYKYHIKE